MKLVHNKTNSQFLFNEIAVLEIQKLSYKVYFKLGSLVLINFNK